MEKLKYYFEIYKKQLIFTVSCMLVILIACISFFIINKKYNNYKIVEENDLTAYLSENDSETENIVDDSITVDIKGSVNNPGVYKLENNSRVSDLINLAGGLTENANTELVNLSKKLADEEIVYIYTNEESETLKTEDNIIPNSSSKNETSNESKTTTISKNIPKTSANTNSSANNTKTSTLNTIVNINSASKEILMTLNGIGESKANKIIEYRNTNGNFKSTDEIKKVKGIGDAIYAKIKDNITV